jgi:hypothetical protein
MPPSRSEGSGPTLGCVEQATRATPTRNTVLGWIIAKTPSPRTAAAIGAILVLPSLAGGLVFDDVVHMRSARGRPLFVERSPFDMFHFADGVAAHGRTLIERGILPWPAAPTLRLAFFRPLTAATHWLDHAVLHLPPWAMHAESIAWYALAVFLVGCLFRRLMSPGAAGLAAVFYALHPGHAFPAGWIANRNGTLATVFGVAAILAYDRARRDGWRVGRWAGPLLCALSLASSELGLTTFAFLAAHLVTLDRARLRERALAFAPYVGVLVLWQAIYRGGGYGVDGSGAYTDPLREPLAFVGQLAVRVPALLAGEVAVIPPEPAGLMTGAPRAGAVLIAVLVLAFVVRESVPLLRRDAGARFLAIGTVLATLPACATYPAARVMVFAGLGGIGLAALLVQDATQGIATRLSAHIVARALAFLHLVIAPLLLAPGVLIPYFLGRHLEAASRGLPDAADVADHTIVVVRAPLCLGTVYRFGVSHTADGAEPARVRPLAMQIGPARVTRTDDRTLLVHADRGVMNDPTTFLFRDHPMQLGESVALSDLTITITAVDAHGDATDATFRFTTPLEDPERAWVTWNRGRFERFVPMAVGASVDLYD